MPISNRLPKLVSSENANKASSNAKAVKIWLKMTIIPENLVYVISLSLTEKIGKMYRSIYNDSKEQLHRLINKMGKRAHSAAH